MADDVIMLIRPFQPEDADSVIDLWIRCRLVHPTNDPRKDIERKAAVRPDLFLVGLVEDRIIGSVMIGYEGHRGWINYLGVCPDHRKSGYGRQLMEEAERLLRVEGCAKINLQVRASNRAVVDFYRSIGFVEDDVISMGKRLIHDDQD